MQALAVSPDSAARGIGNDDTTMSIYSGGIDVTAFASANPDDTALGPKPNQRVERIRFS